MEMDEHSASDSRRILNARYIIRPLSLSGLRSAGLLSPFSRRCHRVLPPTFRIWCSILLFSFLLSGAASAQHFGGNPPSIKWRQINTDTVRVIFPQSLHQMGTEVAAIVHHLARSSLSTIGGRTRKIDIVLQNQTIRSNGYVGLGPYRSEFYLTPRQNNFELGSLPWHHSLALHEYRHVQQFNNFRKGLSRVMYYAFGEQGQGFANSTAVPDWFFEGDAVDQETRYSLQGRGRLPYFFNPYRSLWAAGKDYSWMKLRNGSYRDMVPDHYRLGYMLVAYGRGRYGNDIWRNISGEAAAFRGLFYPFQRAFRNHTGQRFGAFRDEALETFREGKTPILSGAEPSGGPEDPLSPKLSSPAARNDTAARFGAAHKHFAADEEFPQWINDTSIVYVRSSYRNTPAFYTRNILTGAEKRIKWKNISPDNYFSYRNGKIVYTSFQTDARWAWRNYSVITVLDTETGEQSTITQKSKYFSPDISADGNRVVAALYEPSGHSTLHLLAAASGALITEMPNPNSYVFTQTKFFQGDSVVSAVRNARGEMALMVFDLLNGGSRPLVPFGMHVIGWPQVNRDTVFFTMSYGDRDRLFAEAGGRHYIFLPEWKNSSTGSYHLSAANGQYAWTVFTAAGMHTLHGRGKWQPVQIAPYANRPLAPGQPQIPHTNSPLAPNPAPIAPRINRSPQADTSRNAVQQWVIHPGMQEATPSTALWESGAERYPITPYRKTTRLFNFHSWRPFISDPEYSYSLIGENILNTLLSDLSLTYNRNERSLETSASFRYGGWFPVLSAGGAYVLHRSLPDSAGSITWNEANTSVGAGIPLSFHQGLYTRRLNLNGSFNTRQVQYTGAAKQRYANKQFNFADFSVSFTNQRLKALQNIYPAFAQAVSFRHRAVLNHYTARQSLLNGAFYFPGFSVNHSLVLQAAYQGRDTLQQYNFSNIFPFARGYPNLNFPRMWKLGINYHFPVAYPDLGFANIAYLLRVRANIYYDHAQVKSLRNGQHQSFRSAGAEVYFDSKWWNQLPVSFGIRYSRLLDGSILGVSANQWKLVLPLTLFTN